MNDKHFEITVVVNGKPEQVKVGFDEQVEKAVEAALEQSGNKGQPADQWELRDESGQILDVSKTIGALDIKKGAKLFLNLKAGVGGSRV